MTTPLFPDALPGPRLSDGDPLPDNLRSHRGLGECTLQANFEVNSDRRGLKARESSRTAEGYSQHNTASCNTTPDSSSMTAPGTEVARLLSLNKLQVEVFLREQKKDPTSPASFTLNDMLSFSKDPIPTSLTRMSSDLSSRAVKMFLIVLKYVGQGGDDLTEAERTQLVQKLYKHTLRRLELRDELFAQLIKQLRNNPHRLSSLRAWELLNLIGAAMPPGKELAGFISEFVHEHAHGQNWDPEIRTAALATWQSLKRSGKAGPRKMVPTAEEVDSFKERRQLTTIAFFLDDTYEDLTYDMTTTVAEAVEQLAGMIRLKQFHTFSLFECRRLIATGKANEAYQDEHICLDENKYIGDLVAEFKALQEKSKDGEMVQCKLLFKKLLFRDSDEAVTDSVFVQLSYVQAQHDYLLGNYPVDHKDAAQLAALQVIVERGPHTSPETSMDWSLIVDRCVPRQVLPAQAKEEWESDVLNGFKNMIHLDKDDARQQFLRTLQVLPYGKSVFFNVRRIKDPIGLLPGQLILGVNKRGVHFLCPISKEYIHTVELRNLAQIGRSKTAFRLKMRVAGEMHVFEFETKQGEHIFLTLQTHINDIVLRRTPATQPIHFPLCATNAEASQAAAARQQQKALDVGARSKATSRMNHALGKDSDSKMMQSQRGCHEEKLHGETEQWEDLKDQLAAQEAVRMTLGKECHAFREATGKFNPQSEQGPSTGMSTHSAVKSSSAAPLSEIDVNTLPTTTRGGRDVENEADVVEATGAQWGLKLDSLRTRVVQPCVEAGRQLTILVHSRDPQFLLELLSRAVASELLPLCSPDSPPSPPVKLAQVCYTEGQELDLMKVGEAPIIAVPSGVNCALRRLRWLKCQSAVEVCGHVGRNLSIAPSQEAMHVVHLQVAGGPLITLKQTGGPARRMAAQGGWWGKQDPPLDCHDVLMGYCESKAGPNSCGEGSTAALGVRLWNKVSAVLFGRPGASHRSSGGMGVCLVVPLSGLPTTSSSVETVVEPCIEVKEWLTDKQQQQTGKPKTGTPRLLVKDIQAKPKTLDRLVEMKATSAPKPAKKEALPLAEQDGALSRKSGPLENKEEMGVGRSEPGVQQDAGLAVRQGEMSTPQTGDHGEETLPGKGNSNRWGGFDGADVISSSDGVTPEERTRIVPYATSRLEASRRPWDCAQRPWYGTQARSSSDRHGKLRFGAATVAKQGPGVGGHTIVRNERFAPFESHEGPINYLDAVSIFLALLMAIGGRLLIYIPGFNHGHEDAILGAVKFAELAGFKGWIFVMDWVSLHRLWGYVRDSEYAADAGFWLATGPHRGSVPGVLSLLLKLRVPGAPAPLFPELTVLAHSMGCYVLFRGIEWNFRDWPEDARNAVLRIMAVQPDCPADSILTAMIVLVGDLALSASARCALVYSLIDRALWLSAWLRLGEERAGMGHWMPFPRRSACESLDATPIGLLFWPSANHGPHMQPGVVVEDIGAFALGRTNTSTARCNRKICQHRDADVSNDDHLWWSEFIRQRVTPQSEEATYSELQPGGAEWDMWGSDV